MSLDPVLLLTERPGVHELALNRPDRLNALNQPLAEALLSYFEQRRRDTETRVIVLRGEGRAFCAGADLKALGGPDALRDGPNGDWVLRDLMKAMRACPQPIIGLVQGAAAGGGLAIALACDVIMAAEDACFHPAFLKVGLSGAELGVSWRLQRTIGVSRAREVLLTGRSLCADEALRAGLVSAIAPPGELVTRGHDIATRMLAALPDALRLTKRTLDAALACPSLDAVMELEERAQMLMVAREGGLRRR